MSRLPLLLAPLLVIGCGSAAPVELEDYPEEAVDASCRLTFECCEEGMRRGYADEAACVADRMGSLDGFVDAVRTSIEAGRLAYDAALAGDCLANASCADVEMPMANGRCAAILVPLVPEGGDCTSPTECTVGTCFITSTDGMGTCVIPPDVGEPCEGICAEGARCDTTAPSPTCVALAAVGEPCESAFDCASFACEAMVCVETTGSFCGS